MAKDLSSDLNNAAAAWRLKAEQHQAAAEKIKAAGPRKTAGPVSRDIMHANLDAWLDQLEPHQLRAQRYTERAQAATEKGLMLDHGADSESQEFRVNHVGLYNDAAAAQRLKFIKPGQNLSVPGSDR